MYKILDNLNYDNCDICYQSSFKLYQTILQNWTNEINSIAQDELLRLKTL